MVEIKANAKVNLVLDIIGKRSDGYHDLETIFQAIDLYDLISLEEKERGIEIVCNVPNIPLDRGNLAYRAAELIIEATGITRGVKINIDKHIPTEAGLAGGSADGAAVLRGLNSLWQLGFGEDELCRLGRTIGADIPFCILGGTALAQGIGEILTPLPSPNPPLWLVLVKPKLAFSTRWVYETSDLLEERSNERKVDLMKEALSRNDIDSIVANLSNDLEGAVIPNYPLIGELKEQLILASAEGALMAGSGSAVFGITYNKDRAEVIAAKLRSYPGVEEVFVVPTLTKEECL